MEHTLTLRHKTQTTHSLCNIESIQAYLSPLKNDKQRHPVTVLLLFVTFCLTQTKIQTPSL